MPKASPPVGPICARVQQSSCQLVGKATVQAVLKHIVFLESFKIYLMLYSMLLAVTSAKHHACARGNPRQLGQLSRPCSGSSSHLCRRKPQIEMAESLYCCYSPGQQSPALVNILLVRKWPTD